MSFFTDGQEQDPWQDPDSLAFPWKFEESVRSPIHAFLEAAFEKRLKAKPDANGELPELPDADYYYDVIMEGEDTLRNVPGAADSMVAPEFQQQVKEAVPQIMASLLNVLMKPSRSRLQAFYQIVNSIPPICYGDDLYEFCAELDEASFSALQSLGVMLMTEAPDREVVKLGILLCAISIDDEIWSSFDVFSWHDEFTAYTVMGVVLGSELYGADPRDALLKIAKSADGWGRIHAVEMLCSCKEITPEIEEWLIAEGHNNKIDPIATAHICAGRIDLKALLSRDDLTAEMVEGAGKILNALIISTDESGDLEAILDHEDGLEFCRLYMEAVKGQPSNVYTYLTMMNIGLFLNMNTQDPSAAQFLVKIGWAVEDAKKLAKEIALYLKSSEWTDIVSEALRSDSSEEFFWALAAAEEMKDIDDWEFCYERQKDKKDIVWTQLLRSPYPERLDKAFVLAEEQLDLDALASGAKLNYGTGTEYEDYYELEMIVEAMHGMMYGGHDGRGWPFLKAAINCPIVPLRCLALEVFYLWETHNRTDEMKSYIQELSFKEPNPDVKAIMVKIAKGQKVPLFEEDADAVY